MDSSFFKSQTPANFSDAQLVGLDCSIAASQHCFISAYLQQCSIAELPGSFFISPGAGPGAARIQPESSRIPVGTRPDSSQNLVGVRPELGRIPAGIRLKSGWIPVGIWADSGQNFSVEPRGRKKKMNPMMNFVVLACFLCVMNLMNVQYCVFQWVMNLDELSQLHCIFTIHEPYEPFWGSYMNPVKVHHQVLFFRLFPRSFAARGAGKGSLPDS